ncbi:chemotaxis protein methyltransferase CheR [Inhella inkyongensis]|uniref:Chemotaxis protein methyltransferase n=1 Tax=Inhella inkyongensis TaxID=392593 RepID=A0A840SB22_9BURK|nr:CheR family methyltransferase [Inhella inkyongensis]MBB5205671.1 chemotaxis protein methyltransferase CheR [Inhella inkyongensis]
MAQLQAATFAAITELFHRVSGIRLVESKQALVYGRLQKLALDHGQGADVEAFAQRLVRGQVSEALMVDLVDRLTTNETYFFREPQHFDDLRQRAQGAKSAREFLVWSGASSSGEEAYSIAMLLADCLGLNHPWSIWGTDLSTAMVESARQGLYSMERARNVPADYLRRFCLKGTQRYEGQLLMARELRAKTQFLGANLMQPLPGNLPAFDVIFLRNVLIYFDATAKAAIVRRVIEKLKPDGVLYTGHAESLTGLNLPLQAVAPAIYRHG